MLRKFASLDYIRGGRAGWNIAAQRFYDQVNEKLEEGGRQKGTLKIMPGLSPIIGKTEEEAEQKFKALQELIPASTAVMVLSGFLNYDLSGYPVDEPLPSHIPDPVAASNGMKSRVKLFMDMAYQERLSILELGRKILSTRGHMQFVGTPEQLADMMQEWFEARACDGFNIMPPVLPGDLDDFVNLVIPVLQQRGLFREEYTGVTLREHLGLERPEAGHFKVKEEQKAGANSHS